ncbi:hypothetical protein BJF84_17585 [Rhodococcus sp. CUA-806]|nr:hypothetical protein BJF84_17585 [Rhodococcus sp. CUA-806]
MDVFMAAESVDRFDVGVVGEYQGADIEGDGPSAWRRPITTEGFNRRGCPCEVFDQYPCRCLFVWAVNLYSVTNR